VDDFSRREDHIEARYRRGLLHLARDERQLIRDVVVARRYIVAEQLVDRIREAKTKWPELANARQGIVQARQQIFAGALVPHLENEGEVIHPAGDQLDIRRLHAHRFREVVFVWITPSQ